MRVSNWGNLCELLVDNSHRINPSDRDLVSLYYRTQPDQNIYSMNVNNRVHHSLHLGLSLSLSLAPKVGK